MRFIVQQNQFRMIYNNWENVPENEQDIFRLCMHFRAQEIERSNTRYLIEPQPQIKENNEH